MSDFLRAVRAEWTKFRTVRAWVVATAVAGLLMLGLGLLTSNLSESSIDGRPGHPYVPIGPDGQAVADAFYFVHAPLAADGTVTARISALTGAVLGGGGEGGAGGGGTRPGSDGPVQTAAGVQPWTKAGLIIKANTSQGSAYAAVMVTGGHGVRMQYDYTGDLAGPERPAATPQWLRLTRAGTAITGYTSTDGSTWTRIGAVQVPKLGATAQVGMFVASPAKHVMISQQLGGGTGGAFPTVASATFDALELTGGATPDRWTGTAIGDSGIPDDMRQFHQAGSGYAVTGSGDIGPDAGDSGTTIAQTLVGAFLALAVLVVLAVLFVTTEYRRGLIRTSLTTSPRRVRVLAAKALVLGAVAFVIGLVAAAVAVPLGQHFLRGNGNFVYPISGPTELRLVLGTAALLAVASILALAAGTVMRRSAAAVASVIVLIVLPYILATAGVLPVGPSRWLLRVTPAAAFAIQQSIPAYPQVDHDYTPINGFYPLAPWAGFAVLCVWAAVALGAAGYLLRRRDA
jgi:ABC-type transport system involved in multi-copper enzyme maturation permease subunit